MPPATPPSMCTTRHRIIWGDQPTALPVDVPVHLVVTSPPYPMVQMWDEGFSAKSPAAAEALAQEDGPRAF